MNARSYSVSSWLFARTLGAVLLIAFVSLGIQAAGLFGSHGIAPIEPFVASAKRAGHGFWDHPSVFWWSSGDVAIMTVWLIGAAAALALLAGLVPRVALAVSWFAYLSFVSVGWPFMSFQWDTLLLETCATAFFFVPWRVWDRPTGHVDPHPVARWALWWLLFRLVFRSAYVKLASGDPTWADLSALTYHYWTQPLPNPVAWYASQLPKWFQTVSCTAMFLIEFGAPFLIWVPRAFARRTAAAAITALMLLIALTGNYGFFNLLTIALCIPLLDDAALPRILRSRFSTSNEVVDRSRWHTWPGVGPALVIAASALIFFAGTFGERPPRWLGPLYRLGTFNNYGLFAVMTTDRPEIELEGTLDGETWTPYVFKYKPGALDRAPPWVAPHQPRLDWQMWFAALGDARRNPWLGVVVRRLLRGEPAVLELLESNPFEDQPPKQIRTLIYHYEPTTWSEREATGNWWKRNDKALYAPILGVPIEPTSTEE